jgi:hypothetical protein
MRRYQIYNRKPGSGDAEHDQPNLRSLFIIFLIFGFLLSFIPILEPIHKLGQSLEGPVAGGLESWSTSYGGHLEVSGLLTGFKWEFWFACLVTFIVSILIVKHEDFPWVGVSWGYANGVTFFALIACEVPLLSRPVGYAMPGFFKTWLLSIVPILIVGWILIGRRLWRPEVKR